MTKRTDSRGLPVVDLVGPGPLSASVSFQRHVLGVEMFQVSPAYFGRVASDFGPEAARSILARVDELGGGWSALERLGAK